MKHSLISDQTRRALNTLHENVRETLPHAQVARFAALLQRTIGLDPASIGENAIERAVSDRFAAWRADQADHVDCADDASTLDIDDFWIAVNGGPEQLQALVEAVVVPETWFFRDGEAFNAMVTLARVRLLDQPFKPVRILSMPCSTGEEAYTIAMAMLDAGFAPERFSIDAIDVSGRALHIAREARYGSNAFRSRALGFRDRFFKPVGDQWRLCADVTERVRFRQANLLTLDPHAIEPFDFVFCRNVLIYFDRETQRIAMRVLEGLLASGGTLFVGPAETGLMMREGMASAKLALAFAFRRPEGDVLSYGPALGDAPDWRRQDSRSTALYAAIANAGKVPGPPPHATSRAALHGETHEGSPRAEPRVAPRAAFAGMNAAAANWFAPSGGASAGSSAMASAPRLFGVPSTNTPRHMLPAAASAAAVAAQPVLPQQSTLNQSTLNQARALADTGALLEATTLARAYLKANPASADAYYLLGVIADAQGEQADARAHYKRALYLAPDHGEALTHLAAVLGLEGDQAGARLLLARAKRASGGRNE
jgi:chemotaxis protein methyltransferase WspC